MQDLVPIKVKIGLRTNGHADHPDWQRLPLSLSENPATHMFHGWKYDKTCGHKEASADSPLGMQWGMMLVTEQLANEAVATFPETITIMTEAEAETFWNEKAHAHMPENKTYFQVLQALQTELSLRESLGQNTDVLKAKIVKALDPDDDTELGLKKDKQKYWADAKTRLDISIKK